MTHTKAQLSKKAMLVRLHISSWSGRAKDTVVTNEVTATKKASKDAGAWWTYLVPKTDMKEINDAVKKCRNIWWECTLPWNDDGCRIMSSTMFLKYRDRIKAAEVEFMAAVDRFVDRYPDIVQHAKDRLGDLANTKQLPSQYDIRSRFGLQQTILPLPFGTDFRVDLSETDVSAIRDQIEADCNAAITKAMTDIWCRLNEMVQKMHKTLKDPKKIFRDTLVTNITDFCKLIPDLNITDDDNLNALRDEVLAELTKLKPDDLRKNQHQRKDISTKAEKILKKMEGYMA